MKIKNIWKRTFEQTTLKAFACIICIFKFI